MPLSQRGPAAGRVLADEDLGALFGVELQGEAEAAPARGSKRAKAPAATAAEAPARPANKKTKVTATPETTQKSSTKVTTTPAAPPPPPTKPARPKPARCLYPGCRLARTPGDKGYCSVHGMMWRDGDIAGPGALQK